MRARDSLILVCVLACSAACSHDLDKLKLPATGSHAGTGASGDGAGSGSSGNGGDGASGESGASGAGGASGDNGGGPVVDGGIDTCTPCDAPAPILNGSVKPEACCTGSHGSECGVKFAAVDRCYAKDVAGPKDSACPDASKGGVTFPGCCRPDGQCGIVVAELGLGCVVRQEVPPGLGGPLSAHTCVPSCKSDTECKKFSSDLVCAEDDSHKADQRACARFCQRDKDCIDLPDTLCAIQYNLTEDKINFICRKSIGSGVQGDPCSHAEDCEHGACAQKKGSVPVQQYCTQLCGGALDCPGTKLSCSLTNIPTPKSTTLDPKSQPVRICAEQ